MNKVKKLFILMLCMFGIILNANCMAKIKTIKFATEATFPPFEYVTSGGKMQGFDIDLINALCKEIGATCTIANQPFDSLIPSLKVGKFDAIIGGMAITTERAKQVDFTISYYMDTVSFVAAKTSKLIISNDGLKGKTVGVQGGTSYEHYLEDTYGKLIKLKLYTSNEDALLDLKNGRVDACLTDTPLIMQWLKKGNSDGFAIVGKPIESQKYFGSGNGIAVKKGNKELLNALNKAIAKLKADGTLKKLEQKYFGTTP